MTTFLSRRRTSSWLMVVLLLAVVLAVSACGGGGSAPASSSGGGGGGGSSASSGGSGGSSGTSASGQGSGGGTQAQPQQPAKQAPEQPNLKVGIPVDAATFLPLYVADKKGYFEGEGLRVELYTFQGDAGVVQALAGKSIDIAVASPTGLVKTLRSGQPFRAFWGGFNQSDFEWYSAKLTSLSEAKGATFGITTYGSLTDFLTRHALRNAGLNPEKDVQILQAGDGGARLAALESGQLDISILSTPFKFIAAEKGLNLVISEKRDITPTWPQHVVYGIDDFVKSKPETIKAFLRAMVKSIGHIESNPDDAVQILMDRLKLEEHLARMSVEDVTPGFDKRGGFDKTGLDLFWEISVEAGDVDHPWTYEEWFDMTYINTQDEWMNL